MKTVDNLRVGPRLADEVEHLRQQRITEARHMLEREFVDAVLRDDPQVEVSCMTEHRNERENIALGDLVYSLMFDDSTGVHLRALLHALAHADDECTAGLLCQLAQAYADDQVDLLEQRGAL